MLRSLLLLLAALVAFSSPLAHAQTPTWESAIAAFEASDAKAMPAPGAILFLGSSSIRMWSTLEKDFPRRAVLNRGFGGSQIVDSVGYADRIVVPYRPRTIVFYAGDNDLSMGKSPQQVLADFQALATKVRAKLPRTRILFISIKPSTARWALVDRIREANGLIESYTKTSKQLGFIDIFPAMLGADGKPRPELLLSDGLHMTPAGYAIWTKAVTKALR